MKIRQEYGLEDKTIIVPVNLNELLLWKYKDQLVENYKKIGNIQYPALYSLIVNLKVEFLRYALHYNLFSSDHFMWLDYGVSTRGYCDDDINGVHNIISNINPKITIGVIDPADKDYSTLMTGFCWSAIGGMITLPKNSLYFIQAWEKEFIQAVQKGFYPLEEGILTYLKIKNSQWFNIFYGNYDTIFVNYKNNNPQTSKDKPNYTMFNKLVALNKEIYAKSGFNFNEINNKNLSKEKIGEVAKLIFDYMKIDNKYYYGFHFKLLNEADFNLFNELNWIRYQKDTSFY